MHISSLSLAHFRSYRAQHIQMPNGFVAFVGENGVGKTNILEASSILTSGKGLRNLSNWSSLGYYGEKNWSIQGHIHRHDAPVVIKATSDISGRGRLVYVNDKRVNSAHLTSFLSALWLSAREELLWEESASFRRHFLDRMATHFFPKYNTYRKSYKKSLTERQTLLRLPHIDHHWIASVEKNMAQSGIILASYRYEMVVLLLKKVLHRLCQNYQFPQFSLSLEGDLEMILEKRGALLAEEWFLHKLQENRQQDIQTGRCSFGPHLSDLSVVYQEKSMPASQCSRGEQTALSLLLLAGQCYYIKERTGHTPILIIDEMLSYLDQHYLEKIISLFTDLKTQILLTGTLQNTAIKQPFMHVISLPL